MTTAQLFQRVGRRAGDGDFTKLGLTEQGDVMEACSAAMQRVYHALPQYFKEMPEGFALPAPATVTLAVVQYTNALSSDVFDTSQIGRSIALAGDPQWNQIIGTDKLLNPYMGPTGTVSGTVYGDAIFSQRYPFERIVGNPQFADQSFSPLWSRQILPISTSPSRWLYQKTTGIPQYWWVDYLGNSQGMQPIVVLRFLPAPDRAYAINVRMSYWAKRFTIQDYITASTIPVPDQFLDAALIPMAIGELMTKPSFKPNNDNDLLLGQVASAIQFLKEQMSSGATPNNRVFTPIGF